MSSDTLRRVRSRLLLFLGAAVFGCLVAAEHNPAHAFPHVVKAGETLARIAERTYGRVEMERLLVAANSLDASGGISVIAGMRLAAILWRLELPAVRLPEDNG